MELSFDGTKGSGGQFRDLCACVCVCARTWSSFHTACSRKTDGRQTGRMTKPRKRGHPGGQMGNRRRDGSCSWGAGGRETAREEREGRAGRLEGRGRRRPRSGRWRPIMRPWRWWRWCGDEGGGGGGLQASRGISSDVGTRDARREREEARVREAGGGAERSHERRGK